MAVKMLRLPIFRAFTHTKLESVGLPGGVANKSHITEMSNVTNTLINRKLHVPPLRQTHQGAPDGTARGWIERTEVEGGTLYGLCAFTEKAQEQVTDKELRWFSAGIRRDFALTGETNSPRLPGLYVDHVALLGDEHPQVKGLVDLSTVTFSEGETAPTPSTIYFSYDEANGEVTYFAQSEERFTKEEPTVTTPAAAVPALTTPEGLAQFMTTISAQVTEMKGEVTKANARADKAEADLAAAKVDGAKAEFTAYDTKILTPAIEAATKRLALGTEAQKHFRTIGARCFGDRDSEAAFAEAMKYLAPVVPGTRIPPPATGDTTTRANASTAAGSAEFGEGNNELTVAHFREAISSPAVAQKLSAVLDYERVAQKNPKLTLAEFKAQVEGK